MWPGENRSFVRITRPICGDLECFFVCFLVDELDELSSEDPLVFRYCVSLLLFPSDEVTSLGTIEVFWLARRVSSWGEIFLDECQGDK